MLPIVKLGALKTGSTALYIFTTLTSRSVYAVYFQIFLPVIIEFGTS